MNHTRNTDGMSTDTLPGAAPPEAARSKPFDRVIRSKVAWTVWALVPVAALAWGFGPGQAAIDRDRAGRFIAAASVAEAHAEEAQAAAYAAHQTALAARKRAEATRDPADFEVVKSTRDAENAAYTAAAEAWKAVAEPLGQAHELLDRIGDPRAEEVQVARARALIHGGEVLEGVIELEAVIDALTARDESHSALAEQARHELGTGLYFGARLLRHAGAPAEDWGAVATAARRQFRYLAEAAQPASDGGAVDGSSAARFPAARFDEHQFNLEMALDLEQASYEELLGAPLPKQCPGAGTCKNQCKALAGHCKGKGKKKSKAPRRDSRGNGAGDNDFEEGW